MMRTIIPSETTTKDMHQYLLGSVAPRPIAFVSTVDENGVPNLAPYSFFNAFSSNPPILVFSSNRRVADNTTKDTLHNIEKTMECVINVVSHDIVRQMAVTSIGFPSGVSEFDKAGFTPIESDLVKAFRVKESPAQMECKVEKIIPLGTEGGAGHLIICHVVRMHISEDVIDDNRINPHKMDLMGRMGRAYYSRASGDAIQTIVQSVVKLTIGVDALPARVRNSNILTGNNIGQLGGVETMPNSTEIEAIERMDEVQKILQSDKPYAKLQQYAKTLLDNNDQRTLALKVLLLAEKI